MALGGTPMLSKREVDAAAVESAVSKNHPSVGARVLIKVVRLIVVCDNNNIDIIAQPYPFGYLSNLLLQPRATITYIRVFSIRVRTRNLI